MQLILRAEQNATDLRKSFVTEMLSVCKDLEIDVHGDAVDFQKSSRHPGQSGKLQV